MIGTASIAILASLILLLWIRLIVQSRQGNDSRVVTIEDFSQAQNMLDCLILEKGLTNRIFGSDDAQFISSVGTAEVQSFFEKERKTIAIKWIRKTQKEMARLMDIHLKLASYTYNPSARYEFSFAAKYMLFVLASYIALFMVFIEGPYQTARVFAYTIDATGRLYTTFRLRLDEVNPARLRSLAGREE